MNSFFSFPTHTQTEQHEKRKRINESLLTESSVDGGGGGAVDGGDGEAVLGGVGKDLADVVTSNDTSGDDIEETHCGSCW